MVIPEQTQHSLTQFVLFPSQANLLKDDKKWFINKHVYFRGATKRGESCIRLVATRPHSFSSSQAG